jgi:hypothetical protein
MKSKIFAIILLSCTYNFISAQVKGPERIIGAYTGEQKKELAHGKGKSVGKDTYEGEFKKGMPTIGVYTFGEDVGIEGYKYTKGDSYEGEFSDGLFDGKGKLTFQDKAKPTIEGYWKKGKYSGKTKYGYEVISKNNISRIVVQKNSAAPNKITIQGIVDVIELGAHHIEFNSADGTYNDLTDAKFPFIVNVKGTVSATGTKAEMKILLETPGTWTIQVFTNDITQPK